MSIYPSQEEMNWPSLEQIINYVEEYREHFMPEEHKELAYHIFEHGDYLIVKVTWGVQNIFFVWVYPRVIIEYSEPLNFREYKVFQGYILERLGENNYKVLADSSRMGYKEFWELHDSIKHPE